MHVFTSGAMRSPGREQHANLGHIKMKIKVMKKSQSYNWRKCSVGRTRGRQAAGNKIYYDSIYNWLMMTSMSGGLLPPLLLGRGSSCNCADRRTGSYLRAFVVIKMWKVLVREIKHHQFSWLFWMGVNGARWIITCRGEWNPSILLLGKREYT